MRQVTGLVKALGLEHHAGPLGRLAAEVGEWVVDAAPHARAAGVELEDVGHQPDLVARLGGGCFGVLLPDTDEAGALEAAERQRLAVAGLNLMGRDARLTLTVSVGLAVLPRIDGRAAALAQYLSWASFGLLSRATAAKAGLPEEWAA